MDDFCRICSRSDEFQKFELSTISQISNIRIDDMLVYCTQQQISTGDSLPQHICAECFTALNSAFVFRKLTYHSENGFRQMINRNLTASVSMPSSIALVPIPVEMTDHILPDVAIKEELELGEPLAADIIPVVFTEALSLEENLNSTSDRTDGITQPGKKRGKATRSFAGPTTYVCKDCGYTTQHCFNFKRHQQNQKHSAYSKIVTKRPLHMIKHLIKPFIKPKVTKPPAVKQKPKKPEKKTTRKGGRQRNPIRTLYRCDDCGYQNYITFNFRRHQKNWNHTKVSTFHEPITSTQESMLKCRDCGDEFPSNAILKAHRRSECQTLASNLDSDYVYSDEALAICRSLGTKRRQVKRDMTEQMVKVKTEPRDNEPPSAQVADGEELEDRRNQLDYEDSLLKKE
ncbi:uncharacterized protein LOC135714587 [Ochlerotatus camptorhynchus]|uniref:uncharacterized protein LOC135714587 n=1 Tax=Ochlerotatus camptorhynchus TaxID=644619 RepID=UPI0031CFF167